MAISVNHYENRLTHDAAKVADESKIYAYNFSEVGGEQFADEYLIKVTDIRAQFDNENLAGYFTNQLI